ncbi:MAG: hypothetical protein CMC08_02830 [Flavobacteriaceae bacterium]|nr:hypothetical protein [Flavobacteriaceae bacterium]
MKNLNKFSSAILAGIVAMVSFTSCEDEDKARIPDLDNGGFVKFVEMPVFEAGAEPSTASFNALVEDPNDNVATYSVRVLGDFTGATNDTLAFRSTNSFPFDVGFTAADMSNLFGVPVSTFQEGDSFEFFGTAITEDGRVYEGVAPGFIEPDPDNPSDAGGWNGGMTDNVLLSAAGLLQAFNWEVEFENPEE